MGYERTSGQDTIPTYPYRKRALAGCVGCDLGLDYETSYVQAQEIENINKNLPMQPYPWDAGVPRDWPIKGYIGPSGSYHHPAASLGLGCPSCGMGAENVLENPVVKYALIGLGAYLLYRLLSKK
jgi:hypothetical protein